MNEALRDEHFQRITDEKARRVYDYLCDACERRPGGMTDPDQMMVADVAFAEQVKQQLTDDIAKRGIGKEAHNGRQTYWQDNKSLLENVRKALPETDGKKANPPTAPRS